MHGKYKVNRGKSMVNVFCFKTRQLLRAICKTTLIEKLTNAVVHKERLTKDSIDFEYPAYIHSDQSKCCFLII